MKKIIIFAIVTIVLGVASTSCLKRSKKSIDSLCETSDSITLATYTDSINHYILGDTSRPAFKINISLQYPCPNDTSKNARKIQEYFIANIFGQEYAQFSPKVAVNNYIGNNINQYKNEIESQFVKKPKTKSEVWMNYNTIISTQTGYNQKGIWSYSCLTYIYTGGAHGLETKTCFVYDIYENSPITLNDIFATDNLPKILELIKTDIKQKENSDVYWVDQVTVSENFMVDAKGITWCYNPYEIAPYYIGRTSVTLPYSTISEYIIDESPIRSIFK
ncbi:MAG: DUF3298 domain-containing protein [Bacteroidales bacterium]